MAKKTFTYATDVLVKEKAARKAEREGMTLSEKIHQMLVAYTKPVPRAYSGLSESLTPDSK